MIQKIQLEDLNLHMNLNYPIVDKITNKMVIIMTII